MLHAERLELYNRGQPNKSAAVDLMYQAVQWVMEYGGELTMDETGNISIKNREERKKMTIKELMGAAASQDGTVGIFYKPRTMDAVYSQHGQEPDGYLIWCDCSTAVTAIESYGSVDAAYDELSQ